MSLSAEVGSRLLVVAGEPLGHDPEELRSRAEDLLSRPPYADAEPGPFARALQWVGELVARAIQIFADGIGATGPAGAWVIVVVGSAVLALVVWRLTRGATLDRRSPEVPAAPPARTSLSWAEEARDHEAAGRLRDAARCWYAAMVVDLVERGIVEDVPGRTVRELDGEVARNAPELADRIAAAGEDFDAIVYGNEPATADRVRRIRSLVERPTEVAP